MWRRHGDLLAVGLTESGLVRLAVAPSADRDDGFAAELLADLADPGRRGVLPADTRVVEARHGAALRSLLGRSGWLADEPWTPLSRDLTGPVERCGLRVEVVDADHVQARVAVQRAAVTVWSAGRGRPGLLEPLGVHRDHRGRGHGTAMSLAAAAALRQLGASSATVCTPSSNVAAVATYASAGYGRLPDVTDLRRPG